MAGQNVAGIDQGALIDVAPVMESFNFAGDGLEHPLHGEKLLHQLIVKDPALVGIFGLDEQRKSSKEGPLILSKS